MTVTEKDIYASAKIYIDQYGKDALPNALEMIKLHELKNDFEGRECWNQIAGVIKWMITGIEHDEVRN